MRSLLLLLCGAVACSSSPSASPDALTPGTATLDATFTFVQAHTWASAATSEATSGTSSLVFTNLAGGPDSCQAASTGSNVANLLQVVVSLDTNPAPGTYALAEGWDASYRLADTSCATASQGSASSGTLEIDRVDTSVHGIADVTFPTGRVVVTFNAPFCEAPTAPSVCAQRPSCPAGNGSDPNPPTEACVASP